MRIPKCQVAKKSITIKFITIDLICVTHYDGSNDRFITDYMAKISRYNDTGEKGVKMKFVARKNELEHLNAAYEKPGLFFTVISGRRRIGKTELIKEYIKDKNAIYYMAITSSGSFNLERLSSQLNAHLGRSPYTPAYPNFDALFAELGLLAKEEKLVFVIDEYPYLAEAMPEISAILQSFLDHQWKETNLHLILCGSSMSFMERQVLGSKSPLYGRITSQIRLKAFRFSETAQFLNEMTRDEQAILHTVTGGVAEYLSFVDQSLSVRDNLLQLFLSPNARLLNEPHNLLMQELRQPRTYNTILRAIANGASKFNEIATQAEFTTQANATPYLDALIDLGIVVKEAPYGESPRGRKTIYRIQDGCFRFWFRYVAPYLSAIELNEGERIYDHYIAPDLQHFMGQGFEQIAFDLFDDWTASKLLPDFAPTRGRWWGNNKAKRREEELDLVAKGEKYTFIGEAKWNEKPIGEAVYLELLEASEALPISNTPYYILFSKSGFTPQLQKQEADNTQLLLYDFLKDNFYQYE